jgi:hypothetical protein
MPAFRKKPVVIEAVQYVRNNADEITDFVAPHPVNMGRVIDTGATLIIPTLEGDQEAIPGDWIIKGVKGEFYPCKPDIFEMTYDPA